MKNLMLIIPCFLFLFLGSGCKGSSIFVNEQSSSLEEAIYKSQFFLESFDENVLNFSVASVIKEWPVLFKSKPISPRIRQSNELSLIGKDFVHILINKDKDGKLWLIFLKDKRPPEVVFAKKLN